MVDNGDLETNKWVVRINKLARQLDEDAASMHPSVWNEALGDRHEQYRKLARQRREAS
jgi:hypothetical protein